MVKEQSDVVMRWLVHMKHVVSQLAEQEATGTSRWVNFRLKDLLTITAMILERKHFVTIAHGAARDLERGGDKVSCVETPQMDEKPKKATTKAIPGTPGPHPTHPGIKYPVREPLT